MTTALRVDRTSLAERIISTPDAIAVLHAPAGFGKSWLLETVHARCVVAGHETAVASDAEACRALLDDAIEAPPCWILLDEPNAAGLNPALLRRIAERMAGSGHGLVIATRDLAALPLGRLRAEGRLFLYGPAELAISRRDLAGPAGRMLGSTKAERLTALCAGWPAAIGLLSAWMASSDGQPDDEGHFMGSSGLSAYIAQELLPPLPEAWQRALLFAALVETCDRAMLDAIAPGDDLGRHLPDLLEALPGLLSLSEGQFEIHPLLRIHMARALGRLPFDERSAALERASHACALAGRIPESAVLVTRVGGRQAILDYLRRSHGLRLWMTAGFDTIRQLVEQARRVGLTEEPRLKLLQCIVHLKDGQIADAERLLAEAQPQLAGDVEALRDVEVVRTTVTIYGCRRATPEEISGFGEVLLHNNDDPAWRSLITTMQCVLNTQQAQFDMAIANVTEAVAHARAAGSDYNLMFLDIHMATIALARGDFVRARTYLSQARRAWRQRYHDDVGVQTVLGALGASLEFECGRLTSARAHIRKSSQRMPHAEAWFDIYAHGYEPMARLSVEEVGLAPTLAMLSAQQVRLVAQGLDRVANLLGAIGACLVGEATLRGPLPRLSEVPQISEWPGDGLAWQERELFDLIRAYRALEAGDAAQACITLDALIDFARDRGIRRTELRALLLLTEAYDRSDRPADAALSFAGAIEVATATGMTRAFAEFGGEGVASRVRAALADGGAPTDPAAAGLFRTLVRWFRESDASATRLDLTARERDVLLALDQGGSDKLIGRRLGVSEHAVRFHLKNIYRKLKVHDRVEALNRARGAGEI